MANYTNQMFPSPVAPQGGAGVFDSARPPPRTMTGTIVTPPDSQRPMQTLQQPMAAPAPVGAPAPMTGTVTNPGQQMQQPGVAAPAGQPASWQALLGSYMQAPQQNQFGGYGQGSGLFDRL